MDDPERAPASVPDDRPPEIAEVDRIARREQARRCLLGVVEPAFRELRTAFRRSGRDVRLGRVGGADPTEATILVLDPTGPQFECVVRVAIGPERAVVLKRRTFPDPAAPGGTRLVEGPLLDGPEVLSDARTVTRGAVVSSVSADYWDLQRALGRS